MTFKFTNYLGKRVTITEDSQDRSYNEGKTGLVVDTEPNYYSGTLILFKVRLFDSGEEVWVTAVELIEEEEEEDSDFDAIDPDNVQLREVGFSVKVHLPDGRVVEVHGNGVVTITETTVLHAG